MMMTYPRHVIWEVFLRTCKFVFFSVLLLPVAEIKMNIKQMYS